MTILDSSSLKFWESVGLWGFVFVWVGVAGEGVEIFIKLFRRKLYERKKFCLDVIGAAFWLVLVVALAVEFLGNANAMRIADSINSKLDAEAGQARKEAGVAIERAANIESNNLVLRARIEKLQARRISVEQEKRFIEILKNFPKVPVKVFVARSDKETDDYAEMVRTILDEAGYGSGKLNDIQFVTSEPKSKIGLTIQDYPLLLELYSTNNDAKSIAMPGMIFNVSQKNGKKVQVTFFMDTNSATSAPGLMFNALKEIGVEPLIYPDSTFLKPGEWGIFIPQKF